MLQQVNVVVTLTAMDIEKESHSLRSSATTTSSQIEKEDYLSISDDTEYKSALCGAIFKTDRSETSVSIDATDDEHKQSSSRFNIQRNDSQRLFRSYSVIALPTNKSDLLYSSSPQPNNTAPLKLIIRNAIENKKYYSIIM